MVKIVTVNNTFSELDTIKAEVVRHFSKFIPRLYLGQTKFKWGRFQETKRRIDCRTGENGDYRRG